MTIPKFTQEYCAGIKCRRRLRHLALYASGCSCLLETLQKARVKRPGINRSRANQLQVGAHVFPLPRVPREIHPVIQQTRPPHPPQNPIALPPPRIKHSSSNNLPENNNRGKPNLPPPNRQRETRHGEPPPGAAPIDLARPPLGPRRRVRVHPAAGRGGRPDALPANTRRKITCVLHRFEPDCAPGLCR